jgi:capsular exopolysaccharide synthesis family protein
MLVSQAKVPLEPSSPRVVLYLAVGVVVGLTLGLAGVILAEALDSSFSTGTDLERRIGTPYLGAIPLLSSVAPGTKLSPANYAVAKPLSIYAEAFRHLRVGLLYSTAGRMKVIGVTSALTNEGKTTAAVCLAQTSAIQGTRTVVVDCDLRRRTILRYLDETPTVGLLEVLAGKATLDQALVTLSSGAACLPLVPEGEIHGDILGGPEMDKLLADLSERFDLVILDTAPLLILSDTRALASKCDAVLMIVRWRKTPEAAVRSAVRLLHSAGANVAGLVLSKVDAHHQAPYGYEDAGYYVRTAKGYFR